MGFNGGQSDNSANDLIEEQIMNNNRELETQRDNLSKRRLEIIKSQGGTNWQPGSNPPPPNRSDVIQVAKNPLRGRNG